MGSGPEVLVVAFSVFPALRVHRQAQHLYHGGNARNRPVRDHNESRGRNGVKSQRMAGAERLAASSDIRAKKAWGRGGGQTSHRHRADARPAHTGAAWSSSAPPSCAQPASAEPAAKHSGSFRPAPLALPGGRGFAQQPWKDGRWFRIASTHSASSEHTTAECVSEYTCR